MNWHSKKLGDFLWLSNGLVLMVLLNLLASHFFFRLDLTEEKRFTIKPVTIDMLQQLDDVVYVEVFLEGDLNAGFRRLQRATREVLEEFRIYSHNKVQFVFTDPAAAMGKKAQSEFMKELVSKGINPKNVIDKQGNDRVEKLIFPGALINYDGFETGVTLLKGNGAATAEEVLNQSIEGLEFELANAIYKLTNTNRKRVGLLTGHGELDSLEIASFNNALLDQYDVYKVNLERKSTLENYDALIIAKPRRAFSELDKLKLDQFVMHGGTLLLLLDQLDAVMDSASRADYFAFPYALNLDDLLFKYGLRINPDLIQDLTAAKYPVVTGKVGSRSEIVPMDWPFYPLIYHFASHPVTRNMDAVYLRFVSSIDSVRAVGVKKTPLLFSSTMSRRLTAPVKVGIDDLRDLKPDQFAAGGWPVAYLLDGTFTSLYKNRFLPEGADSTGLRFNSPPTRIIVVSDGDVARNEINPRTGQPLQLGFDPLSQYTFANQELLMNMMAYLTNESGLIEARNKEVRIRPLDKEKISQDRGYWQAVNLILPILVLVAYGMVRAYLRKRKFAKA